MNAVMIEYSHMSHMLVVFVTHQRGFVRPVVCIVILLFHRHLLCSGHAIHYGHVFGCVIFRFVSIVYYSVIVGVTCCRPVDV